MTWRVAGAVRRFGVGMIEMDFKRQNAEMAEEIRRVETTGGPSSREDSTEGGTPSLTRSVCKQTDISLLGPFEAYQTTST